MPALSSQSTAILTMIASGKTYEQILMAHPDFTYLDIFRAASEALGIAQETPRTYTLVEKRERYPRAYEPWSEPEDHQLRGMIQSGETVARIADRLQRNRGAIRSRIVKLNLVQALPQTEQDRLRHRLNHPPTPPH